MRYGRSSVLRYVFPALALGVGAMMLIPADASREAQPQVRSAGNSAYLVAAPSLISEIDAALAPPRETSTDVAVREMRMPDPSVAPDVAPAPEPEVAATPETTDPAQVARVGDVAVNMRAGPSTTTGVIRPLQPGEPLTLTETDGGWASVTTEEGETGWVYASYLTGPGLTGTVTEHAVAQPVAEPPKAKPARSDGTRYARVGSDVYLRAGPSQTAERLFVLPAGERVAIAEIRGRWARVLLRSGASGWVRIR